MSMWNRRSKEEETPIPKPVSAPPRSSQLAKEGIPVSPMSRTVEPVREVQRGGGAAVLGKSVIVKGQIFSREDLTIDGEVEGTVELQEHRLTVGPNGKVMASVKAREMVVLGTVHGDVEISDKIEIRKDAKLVGDIRTARIVIEDEAYFKGNIDIVKKEVKRAPEPAAAPAAAASSSGQASAPKPAQSAPNAQAAGASGSVRPAERK